MRGGRVRLFLTGRKWGVKGAFTARKNSKKKIGRRDAGRVVRNWNDSGRHVDGERDNWDRWDRWDEDRKRVVGCGS